MSLASLLAVANLVLVLASIFGGWIAMRSALSKAESDVQTRVREDLQAENTLLRNRVERVERKNRQLDQLMQLIVDALKKTQNIDLEIDENVILLRSSSGMHVSRIDTVEK